jgi:D-alanyl-lipoteichoic acid acyltransferase DltB (MBOAT superfamily)
MSFVSYSFAVFFGLVLLLRVTLASRRAHAAWTSALIVASFLFYTASTPWHLLVLLCSSGVDVWAAKRIAARPPGSRERRLFLVLPLTVNLTLLAFFKYYVAILVWLGLHKWIPIETAVAFVPAWLSTLPLGISFFTFEAMSYAIDVYRGRLAPVRRLRDYWLFIGFFPHLISGPIVRASEFLYQIDRVRRPRLAVLSTGAYFMIRGFFLKVVVADNLAPIVETLWAPAAAPGGNGAAALLAPVLFAVQILCDFDGYTSIARGAAYVLGFRLPDNFDHPYIAASFQEFWNRWHITLSHWLRDYLYVPLGGNRVPRWRMYVNLMIVMVLGGIWHGAGLTFLAWGALHGLALVVERLLGFNAPRGAGARWPRLLWMAVVQGVVITAWVFFRSPSLDVAIGMLHNIVAGSYRAFDKPDLAWKALLFTLPTIAGHGLAWLRENGFAAPSTPVSRAVAVAVMLYLTLTMFSPENPRFIYFQF